VVAYEINTRTDSESVNVRPYRLPKNIRKMLQDNIINPSASVERAITGRSKKELEK